jgi:hypothetical protein
VMLLCESASEQAAESCAYASSRENEAETKRVDQAKRKQVASRSQTKLSCKTKESSRSKSVS